MRRALIAFLGCFLLGACSGQTAAPVSEMRPISMGPSIRIPVQPLSSEPPAAAPEQNPEVLAVTLGAEDELPQGPQGFDVLDDGSFVICDPLQRRVVFYDSEGQYLDHWSIGFSADSIALGEDSTLTVRRANTGEFYIVDQSGQARPLPAGVRGRSGSPGDEARLLGPGRGIVTAARRRGEAATLEIHVDADESRMVSLSSLGTDENDFTYVVLEISPGGESIEVNKLVRKYNPNGDAVAQIADIPLDYYIHPVDEFRVRNGVVYQLAPHQTEVLIRTWDTN